MQIIGQTELHVTTTKHAYQKPGVLTAMRITAESNDIRVHASDASLIVIKLHTHIEREILFIQKLLLTIPGVKRVKRIDRLKCAPSTSVPIILIPHDSSEE